MSTHQIFLACLLVVSLNVALDTGHPSAEWQRVLPLQSLHSLVRDVMHLVLDYGNIDNGMAREYDDGSSSSNLQPNTTTTPRIAFLNSAALISVGVNLLQRDDTGSQLLLLNALCSWIARRARTSIPSRNRREAAQHDSENNSLSLPRWQYLTIDILSAFSSHLVFFLLLTPECADKHEHFIPLGRATIFALWFLPLAAAVLALPTPAVARRANETWVKPCLDILSIFCLSVAIFGAFSDLAVIAMTSNNNDRAVRFGGLDSLQGFAIGMHHLASCFFVAGNRHPRGDWTWPYAAIAVCWLGLVAFFVHLPPLRMPGGLRCVRVKET